MEKYCLKCDTIFDTVQFFCPNCGTVLQNQVQKNGAQLTPEKEYDYIEFKSPAYTARKPPPIEILLEKYKTVRADFKNHFRPISAEEMAQEILTNKQKYSCHNCSHYYLNYCLKNMSEVVKTAICPSYDLFEQWPTKYSDKRFEKRQLKAFEAIPVQEEDLIRKFSFQVIRLSIKKEEKYFVEFLNQSVTLCNLLFLTPAQAAELEKERKQQPFHSFADISRRTSVKDIIGILVIRILQELAHRESDYYLIQPLKVELEKK